MNIQLFLADQEVELNNKVSFPLNKTFENLNNPTDIIVDYSKSINIPMTITNNKIFGNAYRLDKNIIESKTENIGLYLNPTKRIPFKLMHNGSLLMEGYAKFVSATYTSKNKYYTINLFGTLGEIFQELLKVVTDKGKLNGLDSKYFLSDSKYIPSATYELKRSYVKNCWERTVPVPWVPGVYGTYSIYDMYCFAPTHRGLYNDFKSNKIQVSNTSVIGLPQYLKNKWNDINDAYGADNIIGDGLPDYQMGQYRANRLKPCIAFNHVLRMYVDKCPELTGYEIELDKKWFSQSNPYYANMYYMLDFLDSDVVDIDSDVELFNSNTNEIKSETANSSTKTCSVTMNTLSAASTKSNTTKITIDKFNVGFGVEATQDVISSTNKLTENDIELMPETQVVFEIQVNKKSSSGLTTVSTIQYWTNGKNDSSYHTLSGLTSDNFLPLNVDADNSTNYGTSSSGVPTTAKKFYYATIPSFTVTGDFGSGYQIDVKIRLYNSVGGKNANQDAKPALYKWTWHYKTSLTGWVDYIYGSSNSDITGMETATPEFTAYIDNTPYVKDWRNFPTVNLATIYQNEEPLFNIILKYTKMFGLVWDIDYKEKKIYVNTKPTLFSNYEILDWTDKIDRNKDMKIEPIAFNYKSILFNYDDVDGHRYSNYRNKYGLNIGEKKLYTKYDFNTEEKKLFDGISPSSVSSKVYVPFNKFYSWNKSDILVPEQEQYVLPDCESEDEKSAISINNWYFRGSAITVNEVLITDDSAMMKASKEYCYLDRTYALSNDCAVTTTKMPTFTTAFSKNLTMYGMYFTTPNVDYTFNKYAEQTLNTNIYELFWRKYINERYNPNNKKLTAYFNLSNIDFNEFKFNKLVVFDNQLFMVNKIFDYNINSSESTKCELIQISDLSAYTNGSKTF